MESMLSNTGSGYGSGYGDGWTTVATFAEMSVKAHESFAVVAVGCQVRTIAEWERDWEMIASDNEVTVSESEAKRLIELCKGRIK